ncbi:MAG: HD domain-containing protein [Planctomycetes bacterium]|nr:HD domain-containing protein [Planctomycetota bacterium]
MNILPLDNLQLGVPTEIAYYHVSGTKIFSIGDTPRIADVISLKRLKVNELYHSSDEIHLAKWIAGCGTRKLTLDEVLPSHKLAGDIFSEEGQKLIGMGGTVNRDVRRELKAKGVTDVIVIREYSELGELESYLKDRKKQSAQDSKYAEIKLDPECIISDASTISASRMKRGITREIRIKPQGDPLHEAIDHEPPGFRSDDLKKYYLSLYEKHFNQTREFFDALISENSTAIKTRHIISLANEVIQCLIRDKNLLIVMHQLQTKNDQIVNHTLNVTLICINIASSMGYGREQVLELAYAAFLHDVGMLGEPEDIFEKKDSLSSKEKESIAVHPERGVELIKKLDCIPKSTPYVVYQEHEREDGSGYPNHLKADQIHPFAKIIAVADVFDALTCTRAWRPAMLPYKAMELIIKQSNKGVFCRDVVKAFLRYFSLFPVGSWVQLSTKEIANVIAADPRRYDKPIVRVAFKNEDREIYASPKIIALANEPHIYVAAPVEAPRDLADSQFWIMNLL